MIRSDLLSVGLDRQTHNVNLLYSKHRHLIGKPYMMFGWLRGEVRHLLARFAGESMQIVRWRHPPSISHLTTSWCKPCKLTYPIFSMVIVKSRWQVVGPYVTHPSFSKTIAPFGDALAIGSSQIMSDLSSADWLTDMVPDLPKIGHILMRITWKAMNVQQMSRVMTDILFMVLCMCFIQYIYIYMLLLFLNKYRIECV